MLTVSEKRISLPEQTNINNSIMLSCCLSLQAMRLARLLCYHRRLHSSKSYL